MSDSHNCIGLEAHRSSSDLRMLPQLVDSVEWVSLAEAATASAVLVLPGLWVADSPKPATEIIRARCSAGRHTVVVPRFRAGVLTGILGAPSAVEIAPGEFRSFEWGSHHYAVPGFTVIKTSLHAGKWGEAPGVGTVVLAYRPHMVAGAIVLCAAMVASRLVGVSAETQKNLLHSIIDAASAPIVTVTESIESIPSTRPSSIEEFLDQERDLGAAYLLSRLAVANPDSAKLTETAREHLGILLPAEEIARLQSRFPAAEIAEIRSALQQSGWGSYLRRLPSPAPELKTGDPKR